MFIIREVAIYHNNWSVATDITTTNCVNLQVSYLKSIDFFMLTSFGFIFSALVEYIIVLNTSNVFWRKKKKEMNHDTAEVSLTLPFLDSL